MKKIAVIGGTGIQKLPKAELLSESSCETPFGMPSSTLRCVRLGDVELVFLARHGEDHTILPNEINYRANIYALKALGVNQIISVAAVGSLKENIKPGDFVIVDQFFDRTHKRNDSFFGNGIVGHISFGNPVCPAVHDSLVKAAHTVGATVHNGGTYVNIEGPAFSTRAEANFYRNILKADVVGMTNLTEAKLAREAGMCYATLAQVTDYDCWRDKSEYVSVESILDIIDRNINMTKNILLELLKQNILQTSCKCGGNILESLITPIEKINESEKAKLKIIFNL